MTPKMVPFSSFSSFSPPVAPSPATFAAAFSCAFRAFSSAFRAFSSLIFSCLVFGMVAPPRTSCTFAGVACDDDDVVVDDDNDDDEDDGDDDCGCGCDCSCGEVGEEEVEEEEEDLAASSTAPPPITEDPASVDDDADSCLSSSKFTTASFKNITAISDQ